MLSSVLRTPMAVKVNIEIMRAFVRLRRLLATPGELIAQLRHLADTVQLHDEQIRAIAEVLRQMMEPPPRPRSRFGFHPPGRVCRTETKRMTLPGDCTWTSSATTAWQ